MKRDNESKSNLSKNILKDLKNGKLIRRTINGFDYFFPKLIDGDRTNMYSEKCIYCKNNHYRYYNSKFGKKYYQCENCFGIN
jgi:hypothetical protein